MEKLMTTPFILLHISVLLVIVMIIITFNYKKKTQLHFVFIFLMISVLIWSLGQLLEVYYMFFNNGQVSYYLITFYFIGVSFTPAFLLLLGIIYYNGTILFKIKYALLFIPSIISVVMAATTEKNHLLIVTYAFKNTDIVLGPYFIFHNIITYLYIVIGLSFLIYTSFKTSGFFSKQSILIIIGVLIPFSINILSSYQIIPDLPVYITAVAFSISIVLILLAILKYNFLNVMPIALNHILNQLSDGVIVIDKSLVVLEYNEAITKICNIANIKIARNMNILKVIEDSALKEDNEQSFSSILKMVIKNGIPYTFERTLETSSSIVYLNFVISNVLVREKYYCTTLLVKDITEIKNKMEEIKRNQEILMEKERLASLGHLIGGIAHNLKTPIMSISGISNEVVALGQEYVAAIKDSNITKEDHLEIANDIIEWASKISPYCSYMSEIISAVKGQATQLSTSSEKFFTVKELLSRIRLLMKFELKKNYCELKENIEVSPYSRIKGDIGSLIQVFNNIITNSIQSYNGENGIIDLNVILENGYLKFFIKDYGSGMDINIQNRLFKEMITTKGANGTGLGMYMAYSTIKGHYNGKLTFKSKKNKGTTFIIEVPLYKEKNNET